MADTSQVPSWLLSGGFVPEGERQDVYGKSGEYLGLAWNGGFMPAGSVPQLVTYTSPTGQKTTYDLSRMEGVPPAAPAGSTVSTGGQFLGFTKANPPNSYLNPAYTTTITPSAPTPLATAAATRVTPAPTTAIPATGSLAGTGAGNISLDSIISGLRGWLSEYLASAGIGNLAAKPATPATTAAATPKQIAGPRYSPASRTQQALLQRRNRSLNAQSYLNSLLGKTA